MKQRVVAGLGAILLIAAALVIRSQLADDGTSSGGRGSRNGGGPSDGLPVVACTPDLEPVCYALADAGLIREADPFDLAPRAEGYPTAADPRSDVDGWVTWDATPAVANFEAPGTWPDSQVLGSAPTAILLRATDLADLRGGCGAEVTWDCLGQSDLTIGVGHPGTAEGLARLAALKPALLEPDASANEFDGLLLDRILTSPVRPQATLTDQLGDVLQPGLLAVAVGPRPALERRAQSEQGRARKLQVVDPSPSAAMTVVIATRDGVDLGGLADRARNDERVAQALADIGVVSGDGDLLPDDVVAGFLYQVRDKVG